MRATTQNLPVVRTAVILSIVSAIAGIGLSTWMHSDTGFLVPMLAGLLLGPAHAIAFVPLTFIISRSILEACTASFICLVFIAWSILTVIYAPLVAPLLCSTAWALVVARTWNRPLALFVLPAAGVLSTVALNLAPVYSYMPNPESIMLPAAIASWYLMMIVCLPLIAWSKPMPAPAKTRGNGAVLRPKEQSRSTPHDLTPEAPHPE